MEAVGVKDTAMHAPHVSPGNPGAPGEDAVATYPAPQVPEKVTPQAANPGGQSPHAGEPPVAYCPVPQPAVRVGVCEGVAATLCVGVRDAVAATSSRRP